MSENPFVTSWIDKLKEQAREKDEYGLYTEKALKAQKQLESLGIEW